jgi:Rrf2 family iron-sulfur cluster assembly transcriptional regulator
VFKTETQYALRAATALARHDGSLTIPEMARLTHSPIPMLAKVLYRLARQGIVVGRTGRGGGYRLAKEAAKIPLAEIVHLTEGHDFGRFCLFGLPSCSDDDPCPLHHVWGPVRQGIFDLIERHSVADLALGTVRLPETA